MEPPHRALGRPSSIVESFLRPSTPRPSKARRASPGPSVDQARAQKLSEQYIRDAKEEKARQLNAGVRLHEAVKKADSSKLSELLQANLDLDARDGEGRTALHVAANLGRCEQLDLLLEHKDVDINALDLQKNTPLHLATLSKKRESVEHLLKRGANTEIADKKGHLPKYYALTVPQIKSLFDNPPKVLKKRGKTPEHPENNRFLIPEVILTTRPPVPEGIQLRLSENFRGSLWEPNSDVRWSSVSIWNLIYCQDEVFQNRRAASKKWVHLSATSEMWTKDLVRSLCAARGVTRDRYREMRDFVSRVFKDVDVDGPERKRHFQRQTSSEKRMAEDEMYAIVLPIVDVDKRDYLELARNHHIEVLNGKIEEDVLTDALTFSSVTSDPSQAEHLTRMLQLSNFLGHMQPLPRSLDQSYHEYLDIDKIALLDSDQVMTRYIRHLKVKSLEVIKKSSERRAPEMQHSHFPAMGGANLHDLMAGGMPTSIPPISPPPPTTSPIPPAERGRALNKDDENTNNIQLETIMSEGNLPGGKDYPGADHPLPIESVANTLTANQREAPGPPSPTLSSLKHEDELDEIDHDETKTPFEPDDLITVPHFWLFKLDADTIITLYPERLDENNEARLQDHILNSVCNNKDIQDEEDNLNMDLLVEVILKSCMSFEAKAFVQFLDPDDPKDSHDVEVTYTKAYSNSIAELYVQVTERFDTLRQGLGSLSKDPGAFYRDVKQETKILIRVDDNIGEIGMIKRILLNQAGAFNMFLQAVYGRAGRRGDSHPNMNDDDNAFVLTSLETFSQLESEAERVREMVTTLLDLRQREASIEDSLSMGEQSTMLFIFTTVAVLFAPLSFVCGLLAMQNIEGLPEIWGVSPLAEVFGLSTLGTIGLCLVMWAIYKVYQIIEVASRNRERGVPLAPPPDAPGSSSSPSTAAEAAVAQATPLWSIWGIPRGGPYKAPPGKKTQQYTRAVGAIKAKVKEGKSHAVSSSAWAALPAHYLGGLEGRRRQGVENDAEKGMMRM